MEKWMSRIPDDKHIVLVNIPSTHDSGAKNINCFFSCFAKTQDLSIAEQLNIGVRFFDLRAVISSEKNDSDTDLTCCHGICDLYAHSTCCSCEKLTYKSILLDIRKFLDANPTETVITSTSSGRGEKQPNLRRAEEVYKKYLGDISIDYDVNLTMGQCRGKAINTFYLERPPQKPDSPRVLNSEIRNGTGIGKVHEKYANFSAFQVDWQIKIKEVADMFKVYDYTFEEAEKAFKENPTKFPIEYPISCTGEKKNCCPYPRWQAQKIIPFIKNNIKIVKGKYYGWLKMDFAERDFVERMVESNFPEPDNKKALHSLDGFLEKE